LREAINELWVMGHAAQRGFVVIYGQSFISQHADIIVDTWLVLFTVSTSTLSIERKRAVYAHIRKVFPSHVLQLPSAVLLSKNSN
jgi:hypothetical protein